MTHPYDALLVAFCLQDFELPFLEAVKITLADRYTDNMDGIYKITIRYLLDTLIKSHQSGS